MPDEVLDPLNRLMENMGKEAEKLGMILRDFALHPNPEPGRRPIVTIVCELDPEIVFKDDEQREIDKQFQEMAMREKVEADRQKAEDVRQKLMQEVHGDGGIGLDPNDTPTPTIVTPDGTEIPLPDFVQVGATPDPEKWRVGLVGVDGSLIGQFDTEQEAAEFISTLPSHEDGIYFCDPPDNEDSEVDVSPEELAKWLEEQQGE